MRFIQCPITHKLIPAHLYERPKPQSHAIHGDIEPFISPVDKTIISSRRELADHNRRNDVVAADEFSSDYLNRKKQERLNALNGVHSRQEIKARRQEMYNIATRLERERG